MIFITGMANVFYIWFGRAAKGGSNEERRFWPGHLCVGAAYFFIR